jgi:predicted AAA+ superfamily ATPase
MKRYLTEVIARDMRKKLILISGPRQVGKTTLAKNLSDQTEYLNWDSVEHRAIILKKDWNRASEVVVLDELHKMRKFKLWLKGIFDTEGNKPHLVVTGSARMDTARKMGDSLAGRFFPFRLHPFDLWELQSVPGHSGRLEMSYERLLNQSGFPEPYLEKASSFYPRWARTHLDQILRQDLLDLGSLRDISSMETLISLLQTRVGSAVSMASLARDLQRDPKTVKAWLDVLESLFVIFKVPPYHRNVARAILKEPKYYFYDCARVIGDEGARYENFIALALRKQLDYQGDVQGRFGSLHFLRNKDGQEVDFMIHWEKASSPWLVEAKLSDSNPAEGLRHFGKFFEKPRQVQLVKNLKAERLTADGIRVVPALPWLANVDKEMVAI